MALPDDWPDPNVTRSRVAVEIAAALLGMPGQPLNQAKVLLRKTPGTEFSAALFGSGTVEGIEEVVDGRSALALVNPSTALRMAYLGTGPFRSPQPVRTLAVVPSEDQLVFAVRAETGLCTFEEIASKRFPLHAHTRGTPRHALQFLLEALAGAAGFSFRDVTAWGGGLAYDGVFPRMRSRTVGALRSGALEALFEEGADEWLPLALELGMTILPLSESTIAAAQRIGFRRAIIAKAKYPQLKADVPTVSFSGWPIFVHADADADFVAHCCAALDARKDLIPWQGTGPLPVERMWQDAPDTPIEVPLHPAAERFWTNRFATAHGQGAHKK
jgi:TRAP-type uncharacterized transport system substrate-binding protein